MATYTSIRTTRTGMKVHAGKAVETANFTDYVAICQRPVQTANPWISHFLFTTEQPVSCKKCLAVIAKLQSKT